MTAAIATAQTGRAWKQWAYRYESGALWHVGPRKWVEFHGLPCPIVPVLVEEILGDRYAPEVTHYGWECREGGRQRDTPAMIQVRAGSDPKRALMLLSMCVSIDKDDGAVVALRITESPIVACDDCDGLRADKQKLSEEIARLRAEVERLTALTRKPTLVSAPDDAATRFALLELD
ncbi:MAG TPA: hypothetical protein VLE97_06455 [Gaiellaceae bacterium]|nr:hypothetical protein [Gaiellaceae bacterium]